MIVLVRMINRKIFLAGLLSPMLSWAITYPPYEVFPYLADSTDTPPVNYTKVCEPGKTNESQASYVVLGVFYPRTYQAVAANYDGDLVIPAFIDGLPVRKINAYGFSMCNKLRSVSIPSTMREIGDCAFTWCTALTNVTFAEGTTTIGSSAFSNCVSLTSISLPKTLSLIGEKCFERCSQLTDVYFRGNAPRLLPPSVSGKAYLGEIWYNSNPPYKKPTIHIDPNTTGWIAPYVKGVPEKWPVDFGYIEAYETVAENGSGGGSGTGASGFVTVITEISGSAVAIPESWSHRYPSYQAKFGSDFTRSLTLPTGKLDASGNALLVWQDYVAGTDPTDVNDLFSATISLEASGPSISWTPKLSPTEEAKRKYTIYGRYSLLTGDWTVVQPGSESNYNFFKVTVEMR